MKIRDVIHDDKVLRPDSQLEREQQAFHNVLRTMLFDYEIWKGYDVDPGFDLELSVSDERIQRLLYEHQVWHEKEGLPVFSVSGAQVESGLWGLWEISLNDGDEDRRMIPLFINDAGIYRPAASKLLWNEMLRDKISLSMQKSENMPEEEWSRYSECVTALAEDTFLSMKSQYFQRHKQEYEKRRYALTLRIESANQIGIANIRESRVKKLEGQLAQLQRDYTRRQSICPALRPMLICKVKEPC